MGHRVGSRWDWRFATVPIRVVEMTLPRPIITLTTDFGLADSYVAQMKGAILSINAEAVIVDLSHHIPPQDLLRAASCVGEAYARFPKQTIHVVVVDPGVGSRRTAVALEADEHRFVAPDNGVLSEIVRCCGNVRIVELATTRFWRHPVSHTFHGRDVFAPVAAHWSLDVDLLEFGPQLERPLRRLEIPVATRHADALEGRVLWADAFGNLITNIDDQQLPAPGRENLSVEVAGHRITGVHHFYAEAPEGELLALVGSSGRLEIAVCQGSALETLNCSESPQVRVTGFDSSSQKTETA